MHSIFGLIDPRTMRVFHVGCALEPSTQLKLPPVPIANRIAELLPNRPHIAILQTVDAHPQIAWVKWSKRFRRDLLTQDWAQYEGIANAFTNSKRTRKILGEETQTSDEVQAKFHDFETQNPQVFDEILSAAQAFRAQGRRASGVDEIINSIRYEGGDTTQSDGFKINNTFSAFYARKLQVIDPSLCGLFAMRESMADDLVLLDGRSWRQFAVEHADVLRFAGPDGMEEDSQWLY